MSTLRVTDIEPIGGGTSVNMLGGLNKAWARNVNDTPAVSGSFNIASVTSAGTGDRSVAFTNIFSIANFNTVSSVSTAENNRTVGSAPNSTSSCRLRTWIADTAGASGNSANAAFQGELV